MPGDIPTTHAHSPFQGALGNEGPSFWPSPCCPAFNSGGKWSFTERGWPQDKAQDKAQHGMGLFSSFRDLDSSVSLSLAPLSLLGLMVTYGGELQIQGSEPVIWQFCCVSAGPRLGLSSKCAQGKRCPCVAQTWGPLQRQLGA